MTVGFCICLYKFQTPYSHTPGFHICISVCPVVQYPWISHRGISLTELKQIVSCYPAHSWLLSFQLLSRFQFSLPQSQPCRDWGQLKLCSQISVRVFLDSIRASYQDTGIGKFVRLLRPSHNKTAGFWLNFGEAAFWLEATTAIMINRNSIKGATKLMRWGIWKDVSRYQSIDAGHLRNIHGMNKHVLNEL